MAPQPRADTGDLGSLTSPHPVVQPGPVPRLDLPTTSEGTYKWLWFAVSIVIVVGFAFTTDHEKSLRITTDTVVPESFRLGSGAVGSVNTAPSSLADQATTYATPEVDALMRKLRGTDTAATATQTKHIRYFMYGALVAVVMLATTLMIPTQDGSRDYNYRVPPSWSGVQRVTAAAALEHT